MAPLSFPEKSSGDRMIQKNPSKPTFIVHTMHDDLESPDSGERESSHAEKRIDRQKSAGRLLGTESPSFPVSSSNGTEEMPAQSQERRAADQHPFGIVPDQRNKPADRVPDPSESLLSENGLRPLVQQGGMLSSHPIAKRRFPLVAGIGTAILFVLMAGTGYLFFGSGGKSPESGDFSADVIGQAPEMPEDATRKAAPFSEDSPNYLSFDTETVSPSDIRKTLFQAADRIKEAGISGPIEFLVTDQNNNPLAFSRFAFLLKLDMDSDLLALVDESFSLYEYDDTGSVRLGLMLTFIDAPAAAVLIEKIESQLPYAFRALILEPDVAVGKKIPFRSTNYNRFPVRFANIDSARNVSLDYSLDNGRLFIGMSKNTLRAILDANAK